MPLEDTKRVFTINKQARVVAGETPQFGVGVAGARGGRVSFRFRMRGVMQPKIGERAFLQARGRKRREVAHRMPYQPGLAEAQRAKRISIYAERPSRCISVPAPSIEIECGSMAPLIKTPSWTRGLRPGPLVCVVGQLSIDSSCSPRQLTLRLPLPLLQP